MKFCIKCQQKMDDSCEVCEICGSTLETLLNSNEPEEDNTVEEEEELLTLLPKKPHRPRPETETKKLELPSLEEEDSLLPQRVLTDQDVEAIVEREAEKLRAQQANERLLPQKDEDDTDDSEDTSESLVAEEKPETLLRRRPEPKREPEKKDDDHFTPIPPFRLAQEVERPSPFAPMKNPVTVDSSDDKAAKPAARKPASADSKPDFSHSGKNKGEMSVSTKVCPICTTRAFASERNCKYCGYSFPKSGAIANLEEKSINIVGMLASVAMGLAVFVNFITYNLNGAQQEVALISKIDGYAFLLLALLGLVLSFFGRNVGVITVGTLSVVGSWVENFFIYYDVTQVKKGTRIDNEIGFYLLVAGAALIFISGVVGRIKEKKKLEKYTSYMNVN